MMIELEPSFWNRTGRRNDKSARGHETAQKFDFLGMVQLTQDANAKSRKIKEKFLDPKITEELFEYVPNQFMGADTNCIQMFLCKIEPAFWSMQLTTKNYSEISVRRSLTANLNKWIDFVY